MIRIGCSSFITVANCTRSRYCFGRFISSESTDEVAKSTNEDLENKLNKDNVTATEAVADKSDIFQSVNFLTREMSIIRLTPSSKLYHPPIYNTRLSIEALSGLNDAIVSCDTMPQQLQADADVLFDKLAQRKFPAAPNEVAQVRRQIRNELLANVEHQLDDIIDDPKFLESREQSLRRRVVKELKRTRYNWRPMQLNSRSKAAAYALARLSPNFSIVHRILQEFDNKRTNPTFVPQRVLNYGSGVGSVFWACHQKWSNRVDEYLLVDPSNDVNKFCMDILRAGKTTGPFVHRNISFRQSLPAASSKTEYDLVIAAFTLIEYNSQESRERMLETLYMIIIESAEDSNFRALINARDYILNSGWTIKVEKLVNLLQRDNLLTKNIEQLIVDKKISEYERYQMIKSMCPKEMTLPTVLPIGYVFSPCPHDFTCPSASKWSKMPCYTFARYFDIRVDNRPSPDRDGTGQQKFSYVILAKGNRPIDNHRLTQPRVITDIQRRSGHAICTVCTAHDGLQKFIVSRQSKLLYRIVRKYRHAGTQLPVQFDTLKSESPMHLTNIIDLQSKTEHDIVVCEQKNNTNEDDDKNESNEINLSALIDNN